jgi:nicotinate-nucleotide pyrophosphorylase
MDRFAKLNEFHQEKYLVTRYQTIELDDLALAIVRRVILLRDFSECDLVAEFSGQVEETEIRRFLSKLIGVGALTQPRKE